MDYFRSPLDIPLVLSGNFGELRSNHFHSGIDIKTQGVEGKRVYCTADGYVSRIKISTGGYGKALYVTHPNGFTTVYAHLKKFNDQLEAYVKNAQYGRKSFEIELFPGPSVLRFTKGEVIAISGNSGGSLAPHLHFEIRETKTELPVNPLLFGFNIDDNIVPVVRSVSIYPLNENSLVDGSSLRKDYALINNGSFYELKTKSQPILSGEIGFGIEAFDLLNGAGNHCGIYSIDLFTDDRKIYSHKLEKFSFYETRYINSHIDYGKYKLQNRKTQRSFLLENNRLSIYSNLVNRGKINIAHGEIKTIKYMLSDVYGNETEVRFEVRGDSSYQSSSRSTIVQKPAKLLKCKSKNSFQEDNVIVYMPPNILYEDLNFEFLVDDPLPNALTPTYRIHHESVPLQSYMMVSIKVDNISDELRKKSLVISHTKKDGIYPEGGVWKGNYIVVKTRSFGGYAVMADTVKPVIRPVNIGNNEDMSRKWSIMVKISDSLSGIESYIPTVDGKWVLMEYDAKNDLLIHHFDDVIKPGRHTFELTVNDKVGNTSVYSTEFIR